MERDAFLMFQQVLQDSLSDDDDVDFEEDEPEFERIEDNACKDKNTENKDLDRN